MTRKITNIIIGLVTLIHLYIFVFECFLWEVRGPKVFSSFPLDLFPRTTDLAFNQGVYNLFLALGLLWTFFIKDEKWRRNIALFFLGCVVVAGMAGAMVEPKIFMVQSVPALIGIAMLMFTKQGR